MENRKYSKFEIFYVKEQENHVARCTAKVAVENGNLVIKEFYPFELIEKFKRLGNSTKFIDKN